jgi:hypothetical protein
MTDDFCETCGRYDGQHQLWCKGNVVPTERRVDTSKPVPPWHPLGEPNPEYTGGSVSYYQVKVTAPTSGGDVYTAECNDIIEALGMNYAEGNAFKAIWRRCAARTLGKAKAGYKDGLYDAEKVVFFGQRMVEMEKRHG